MDSKQVKDAVDVLQLARTLTERTLAGDLDGVAELYHDDAVVWRNIDGRELVLRQVLKVIKFLATKVGELRYENVTIQRTDTGFVQQHVLRGIAPGGEPVQVAACLVARVADGRIRRLDEYLDSKALAPLMG